MTKYVNVPRTIIVLTIVLTVFVFFSSARFGTAFGLAATNLSVGALIAFSYWRSRVVAARQLSLLRSISKEIERSLTDLSQLRTSLDNTTEQRNQLKEIREVKESLAQQRKTLISLQAQLDASPSNHF